MSELGQLDERGRVRMVDVSSKEPTLREALARGRVSMRPETLELIRQGRVPKGDVLAVARLAGIMAAKRTPELIPLCHPIPLEAVEVELRPTEGGLEIEARVRARARTGVEMEALSAVAAAALAVYDMCKAVDREMTIGEIALWEKRGGRSGRFRRQA